MTNPPKNYSSLQSATPLHPDPSVVTASSPTPNNVEGCQVYYKGGNLEHLNRFQLQDGRMGFNHIERRLPGHFLGRINSLNIAKDP